MILETSQRPCVHLLVRSNGNNSSELNHIVRYAYNNYLINDFSRCWIVVIVGNIIVHHHNNIFIRNAISVQDLVRMTDVRLDVR